MARATEESRRVEVGFSGGQSIVLKLSDRQYDDLRKAVQSRDGWHEVDTDDGIVAVDLSQVVFMKKEPEEHRIGFSGG
jgi:hypothetical protein